MTELKLHPPGIILYAVSLLIIGGLTYFKVLPQQAGGAALIAILGAMVPSNAVRSVAVQAPVAAPSGDVSLLKAAEVTVTKGEN